MTESLSINAVDARLRRHPKTIRRWCGELGIAIEYRRYRDYEAAYIRAADFERLREYDQTQRRRAVRKPRGVKIRGPEQVGERPDYRIGITEHEARRRVAAARRAKARLCGLDVQDHHIDAEMQ